MGVMPDFLGHGDIHGAAHSGGHGNAHAAPPSTDTTDTTGRGFGLDVASGFGLDSGGHGGGHGAAADQGSGHQAGLGHESIKSRHDQRVNSFSITREGEIVPRRLSLFMQHLPTLPPQYGTVFRIKGIFAIRDNPYKRVFHAVMDISDEDDAGFWQEGE